MRKFYSILGALLIGATSLFAQTNYTVTFSANVEMEKVQVKNLSSGETKMLYSPDNVITLQKVEKQGTPIASVDNPMFLQQTANNEVIVNMEKAGHLNLTLYSSNGSFVARYSNNIDAGQNAFQIGASSGVYVLVASANNQTASLKILLTQSTPPNILEVLTNKPEPLLKSLDDVITFDEGDEFEFTGYYKNQSDVKTAVITGNKQIVFALSSEPSINSTQPIDVLYTTATVGGNVTSDNGATVTERGICWATIDTPTFSDNKKTSGEGVGEFTVPLTDLADATTYYVRAYAINAVGITYGEIISFTTKTISIPTVSSANLTEVSYFSATLEGTITDDNGAAVIEQGICWATTNNPTVSDNKLAADNETGNFSLSLTELADGTTYYVRTYAINSVGVAYGNEISFTTEVVDDVPTAPTITVSTSFFNAVVCFESGGGPISEQGVCWSTKKDPTISDNKMSVSVPLPLLEFEQIFFSIDSLAESTKYYFRAYAENSAGITYGKNISLTTSIPCILKGVFSVSPTKKVRFSQGNLLQNEDICFRKSTMVLCRNTRQRNYSRKRL